ncbi:uncharacterized protein LOC112688054 [Sipha flava]|uniref:Uncharacterized protein LOC112688054 n=1 Tax=Sipha flava TaxID=143950 RepID=A0A8B8G227_9HEMI|nr:uncharacterized protein LOC112688054 [Sipha flava]
MNLVKLSVLIIFSCLCPTEIYSKDTAFDKYKKGKMIVPQSEYSCILPMVNDNKERMPVPFKIFGTQTVMQYPNMNDLLIMEKGDTLRLLCAKSRFLHFHLKYFDEVEVRCMGNNNLELDGLYYFFDEFECQSMPKSDVFTTNQTCHSNKHFMNIVGFASHYGVIPVYAFCYNPVNKDTAYTWYYVKVPYKNSNQEFNITNLPFINPENFYNKISVDLLYTVEYQNYTFSELLKTKELAEKYIRPENGSYLIPGQLASPRDFFYIFEQVATFYFMNTAPRWKKFNDDHWTVLEESVRYWMSENDHRYMIVSGTYGWLSLTTANADRRRIFMDESEQIPVPEVFWKLMYDIDRMDGIVFMGTNSPHEEEESKNSFLCENICKNRRGNNNMSPELFYAPDSIYCCDLSGFQLMYGELQPVKVVKYLREQIEARQKVEKTPVIITKSTNLLKEKKHTESLRIEDYLYSSEEKKHTKSPEEKKHTKSPEEGESTEGCTNLNIY